MFRADRFRDNPIIAPGSDPSLGENINGPSLIRVPPWLERPLGRYYLYFAHHQGAFIRLAYADDLRGPWRIYAPGTLRMSETCCRHHIASPDVHIDAASGRLVMYFHGVADAGQRTFRAESSDGIRWEPDSVDLGTFYFRAWTHRDSLYAVAKAGAGGGGILLRSPDGRTPFEPGPPILPGLRHAAVLKRGDRLVIFYSRIGDSPERILVSEMPLAGDWRSWRPDDPRELLAPELPWEGAGLPVEPSREGSVHRPVCQLRDPAVFEEDGRLFLLYSCAGEHGLGIAELFET